MKFTALLFFWKGGIYMNLVVLAGIFSFFTGIGTLQAIVLILGLVLLIAEMFLPGFGIAGGSGIVLMIIGIILTARTPLEAFIMIVILIALIALLLAIVLRSAKKGKLSKKLILRSASRREDGFSSTADSTDLVGKEGVAISILRPSGIGEFEGQRLDVVSDGGYIEPCTKIKIVQTEGRRIVVKQID